MATYLFAWNPVYWNWPELAGEIRRLKRRGHVDIGWASGRTRSIEPGSRAFMVRLGTPPKGIIGSGFTLTAPTPGRHWIDNKRKAGVPALHLRIRLEVLASTPARVTPATSGVAPDGKTPILRSDPDGR